MDITALQQRKHELVNQIAQLHAQQMSLKVLVNSTYGF
jgi:DNA polymerase elongation subunit (family B)